MDKEYLLDGHNMQRGARTGWRENISFSPLSLCISLSHQPEMVMYVVTPTELHATLCLVVFRNEGFQR